MDLLASCIAVAGLAVSVAHTIDGLRKSFQEAQDTLERVRNNAAGFYFVISNIHRAEPNLDDNTKQQLRPMVANGGPIMKKMQEELDSVARAATAKGWSFGQLLSFSQKAAVVWNQEQIEKCNEEIARQCSLLSGILLSLNLLKSSGVLDSSNTDKIAYPAWPADKGNSANNRFPRLDSLDKQIEKAAKHMSRYENIHVPKDLNFRILLMGKSLHGKSTLSRYVLGLPKTEGPKKVFETRTPISQIWDEQTWSGQNPRLILHDTGGFMTGEEETIKEVRKFIRSRRSGAIKDQIHSIWYCIDCHTAAAIQPIDEKFFAGEFETGEVPIFIIFTNYDLLIAAVRELHDTPMTDYEAEKQAFESFQELKNRTLESLKGNPRVNICRTAIKKGVEFFPSAFTDNEPYGTKMLVSQMTQQLDDHDLKILCVGIQQVNSAEKLSNAVQRCTNLYWRVQLVNILPIPLASLLSFVDAYRDIFNISQDIWRIETALLQTAVFSAMSMSMAQKILGAIFDKEANEILTAGLKQVGDLTGIYYAERRSKRVLKIILGVNLVFCQLWELQHTDPMDVQSKLSQDDIDAVCERFLKSGERERMIRYVEENITFSSCFDLEKTMKTAGEALASAQDSAMQAYSSLERLRKKEVERDDSSSSIEKET